MNYKNMWDNLKNKIREEASIPVENANNIIKAAESVTAKTTYFHVLDIMSKIERECNSSDEKYSI